MARRLRAVHGAQGGARRRAWTAWDDARRGARARRRSSAARARTPTRDRARVGFAQFLFFRQWARAARPLPTSRGIAHHRRHPDLRRPRQRRRLGAPASSSSSTTDGRPRSSPGVPPDYFSATGQLWGNPLYRWDAMRARRLRVVDRALPRGAASWSTSCASTTSAASRRTGRSRRASRPPMNGRWVKGPGAALFEAARARRSARCRSSPRTWA